MVCKGRLCSGGDGSIVVYGEEVMDLMILWKNIWRGENWRKWRKFLDLDSKQHT